MELDEIYTKMVENGISEEIIKIVLPTVLEISKESESRGYGVAMMGGM